MSVFDDDAARALAVKYRAETWRARSETFANVALGLLYGVGAYCVWRVVDYVLSVN